MSCRRWMLASQRVRAATAQALRRTTCALMVGTLGTSALAQHAACRSWPLWDEFKAVHLAPEGRVKDDGPQGERSISEAQAYALFFALVAGDRAAFERILHWSDQHLAQGQLGAQWMAWLWQPRAPEGAAPGTPPEPASAGDVRDANAATDADLWLAYTLMEASRLWRVPAWQTVAEQLTQTLVRQASTGAPTLGPVLLPGVWGFELSPTRWRLNPSYAPPFVMARLFASGPDTALRDSALRLLLEPLAQGARAADWVIWDNALGWQTESGWGSYDAIRVYLWLAMSTPPLKAQACRVSRDWLALAQRASDWLDHWPTHAQAHAPGGAASRTGATMYEAGPGFTATAWALAQACGPASLANDLRQRVLQQVQHAPRGYYQRALLLFATGWLEGRFRFLPQGQLALAPPRQVYFSLPARARGAGAPSVHAHAGLNCRRTL